MTISNAYPDILTNGTTADATQVMADFYQIQNDVNANAAHNGANSDITSLTGLTTPLGIAYGGTSQATASAALVALGAAALAGATFTGAITVPGVVNSSAETIAGTLGVTGATSLSSATISGTLGVTGATSLSSATISGTLGVTGVISGATSSVAATGVTPATADNTTKLATTAWGNLFANPATTNAAAGKVQLPGGTIIMWTSGTANANSNTAIALPATFPNNIFQAYVADNAAVGGTMLTIEAKSTSAVTINNQNGSGHAVSILAVGN